MSEILHLFGPSSLAVGATLAVMAAALPLVAFVAWRRPRWSRNPAFARILSARIGRNLLCLAHRIGLPFGRAACPVREDTNAVYDNIAIWSDESRPLLERHRALDEARTRLNRLADNILAAHAAQQKRRRADPDPDSQLQSPQAEILLVDDEATLRDLTALSLREAGFIVHRADNADEAMEIIRGRAGQIDLVLSDVVMPGRSGPELAHQIAEIHPHIPIIFMSGYEQRRLAKERMIPPAMRCLSKPFTLEELLGIIREVVTSPQRDVARP